MAIANRIVAACPEVQVVEIITITPSGERLRIDDFEPGYKRMSRAAFHPRVDVRRSVGFQASMRRLTAANTWTELIRDQASLAADLAALLWETPARLRPSDSSKHRQQWLTRVEELGARAASLSSRPTKVGADIRMSHGRADDADRGTDPVSEAINLAANRLPAILEGNLAGTASFLRDARNKLALAKQAGNIALGDSGELVRPISQEVLDALGLVAQLLFAINRDPELALRLQLGSLRASAAGVVAEAVSAEDERQRAVLTRATSPVGGAVWHHVADPEPFFGSLSEKAWLVTAPLEEWNDLLEALRSISSEQRMALACNIVAAATNDDSVLPLGASLTHTPGRSEYPLSGEGLEPFVASAGLRMADQAEQLRGLQTFIDHLATLSWDAARRRARPADWPDLPTYDGPGVEGLREMAEHAAQALPTFLQQEVRTAVAVLADHVGAEVSAGRDLPSEAVTLAGEMFDHALDTDHAGPAAPLWDALSTLSAVVTLGAGGRT